MAEAKPNLSEHLENNYRPLLQSFLGEVLQALSEADRLGCSNAWVTDLRSIAKLLSDFNFAQIAHPAGSVLGNSDTPLQDADVWYMTRSEFCQMVKMGEAFMKPVVIRDTELDLANDDSSADDDAIEDVLSRLELLYGNTTLDIQDLEGDEKGLRRVPTSEFVQKFRGKRLNQTSDPQPLGLDDWPFNCLSMKGAIVKENCFFASAGIRFEYLQAAMARADTKVKNFELDRKDPRNPALMPPSNVGKDRRGALLFGKDVDLQSCMDFALLAQRGTYSGWHVDVLNGTYVKCITGLKAWFVHQHPLTDRELEAFTEASTLWEPDPSRVKLILLRPGEELYMPSGEFIAHAPITIKDCLIKGGMLWDSTRLLDTLDNILTIIKTGNSITNEPIPVQLILCWDALEDMVQHEQHLLTAKRKRNDSQEQLPKKRKRSTEPELLRSAGDETKEPSMPTPDLSAAVTPEAVHADSESSLSSAIDVGSSPDVYSAVFVNSDANAGSKTIVGTTNNVVTTISLDSTLNKGHTGELKEKTLGFNEGSGSGSGTSSTPKALSDPGYNPFLARFATITAEIKRHLSCTCKGSCRKSSCPCKRSGASDQRCTPWCHPADYVGGKIKKCVVVASEG